MFRMGSLCTVACVTFLQEEFKVIGIAKTQKHRNTDIHKDPKGERQECATQNPPNTGTETNTPTQTLRDIERKTQTQQLAVSLIDGFCCEQNVSSRFETFRIIL